MNRTLVVGVMAITILTVVIFRSCHMFEASGLDVAMDQFLTVVKDGDTGGFVDLLPDQGLFRFCSYGDRSGNMLAAERYTKSQVIKDLSQRGGLYFAIFGGNSDYRYSDRIVSAPLASWHRVLNIYRWQDPQDSRKKTYVKWVKEGDFWKVSEIGDSVP